MNINNEKVSNFIRFADSYKNMMHISGEFDEAALKQLVDTSIKITQAELTADEEEYIYKELRYRYQIYTSGGEVLLGDYKQEEWYTEKKESIEPRFWSRYKDYLIDELHFNPNVISTLGNDTLDRGLMNCLGNPDSKEEFLRRGLIIGDVQSGKTSTYIGLMCKAADAGYKVFILLTGTIEALRQQTQQRVEEGFIGIDMSSTENGGCRVGVGKDNKHIWARSMTSRLSDFTGKSDNIAVSLQGNDAIVFVIKKNSSVLQKLTRWLVTLNADPITHKIDAPMLLIDDEADNASINTKADKEDPTKINKLIRELISVFTKSNYVGFTATPYANVFIDPETTEEMENHDLFPEDFIISLPTPSNYIGSNKIFPSNGIYHDQLIYIPDCGIDEEDGYSFYYNHKKDWDSDLPDSLTDAIYAFYITNAIRDLRGDNNDHRSMLINMSRFIDVQQRIKQKVEQIHKEAYTAIKFHIDADYNICTKNPVISRIYSVYDELFAGCGYDWDEIADVLFPAIENIQIKVVNSNKRLSDKLVYPKSGSLRVITIGGLALSRGLTLEGLVTSYFYRSTKTYDVLMQMGRWFGYRKNYDDLFRIWIARESADWYAEIAEATDRLKIDMTNMRDRGLCPKNFGIRVRNDSSELKITANNKMRNTTDEYEFESYFGSLIETPYLLPDTVKQKANFNVVKEFVGNCISDGIPMETATGSGKHFVLRNVTKERIIELLDKMQVSRYSAFFDTRQLVPFISNSNDSILDLWDVAFMEGSKDDSENAVSINGNSIRKIKRKNCEIDSDERLKIGQRGKLGGPSDGIICISDFNGKTAGEIIENAKSEFRKHYFDVKQVEFSDSQTYPSDTWFRYIPDRKPLLLIYFIDATDKNKSERMMKFNEDMGDVPATGLAIGFPAVENSISGTLGRYKVNIKYNYYEQYENIDEVDEE